jgi:hypothetical protein
MLKEVDFADTKATTMHPGNQGPLRLAANPSTHQRPKA